MVYVLSQLLALLWELIEIIGDEAELAEMCHRGVPLNGTARYPTAYCWSPTGCEASVTYSCCHTLVAFCGGILSATDPDSWNHVTLD